MRDDESRLSELTSQRELDLITPMLESLDPASAHEVSGGRVEWIVKQPTSTSFRWLLMGLVLGIISLILGLPAGLIYLSKEIPTTSKGND